MGSVNMTEKAEDSSVKPRSKISGHVFSKNGAILNGAKITCDGFETAALADGYYTFDNLPSGNYEVKVILEGFRPESKRITIKKGDVLALDFYLSEAVGTGKIRGCVYDNESRKPIANDGTVILILPIFNKYARINEKGCYEFASLSAGTYKLSTSIPEYEDCDAIVTISEGESKIHDFFCKVKRAVEPPWG